MGEAFQCVQGMSKRSWRSQLHDMILVGFLFWIPASIWRWCLLLDSFVVNLNPCKMPVSVKCVQRFFCWHILFEWIRMWKRRYWKANGTVWVILIIMSVRKLKCYSSEAPPLYLHYWIRMCSLFISSACWQSKFPANITWNYHKVRLRSKISLNYFAIMFYLRGNSFNATKNYSTSLYAIKIFKLPSLP